MKLPIEVSASAVPAASGSTIRYALTALGGYLIGKGWLNAEEWEAISALIITAAPLVYGVYLTFRNHRQKAVLADAAPNSVGNVK